MELYVLALTDCSLPSRRLFGRAYSSVRLGRVFASVQRRLRVPEATEAEVRRQHEVLLDIASRTDAMLPVRFGSLLPKDRLTEVLSAREESILRALEEVRGRMQMTIRIIGTPVSIDRGRRGSSGRDYLQQRLRLTRPDLPTRARRVLSAVKPFVARERRVAGRGRVIAIVYHLVNRDSVSRYIEAADAAGGPSVLVTGPLPPYAFSPALS